MRAIKQKQHGLNGKLIWIDRESPRLSTSPHVGALTLALLRLLVRQERGRILCQADWSESVPDFVGKFDRKMEEN